MSYESKTDDESKTSEDDQQLSEQLPDYSPVLIRHDAVRSLPRQLRNDELPPRYTQTLLRQNITDDSKIDDEQDGGIYRKSKSRKSKSMKRKSKSKKKKSKSKKKKSKSKKKKSRKSK
jgi:hypothetical protein